MTTNFQTWFENQEYFKRFIKMSINDILYDEYKAQQIAVLECAKAMFEQVFEQYFVSNIIIRTNLDYINKKLGELK